MPVLALANQRTGKRRQLDLALDLPGMANENYIMLPSLGDAPGIPVTGQRTLDLVPDPLFSIAASFPNGPVFNGFVGTLDAAGKATATFAIPNDPAALGVDIHLAAVTIVGLSGTVDFVTDTLELTIE